MKLSTLLSVGFSLGISLAHGQSLDELERIAAQAKTFKEFYGSVIVKEQYLNALKKYQHRDRFRCESFEKILTKANAMAEKVPGFAERLWEKLPAETLEVVAYRPVTDASGSLSERYTFRGVPRRLHALWNDPSLVGCYSDACNEADTTTPDRWAIAVKDAELYYVEKNGIFTDQSLLYIPLRQGKKNLRLAIAGGGPQLLRPVDIWNTNRKQSTRQSLVQAVTHRLQQGRWRGQAIDLLLPPGKSETAARQVASSTPKTATPADDFTLEDPLAPAIESASGRKCLVGNLKRKPGLGLALGKLAEDNLEKGALNGLNPLWKDSQTVAQSLAGPQALTALPDPNGLSDAEKDQVDTQLTKIFMDNGLDPSLRARAGLALERMNQPDLDAAFNRRPNWAQPLSININTRPDVRNAFAAALDDKSAPIRTVAAIGAASTLDPLPPKATAALEQAFHPDAVRQLSSLAPDAIRSLKDAAEASGNFPGLPPVSNPGGGTGNTPPNGGASSERFPDLADLERALRKNSSFQFDKFRDKVTDDMKAVAATPDGRRRAVADLAQLMREGIKGGAPNAATAWRESDDSVLANLMNDGIKEAINRPCPKSERGQRPTTAQRSYWEQFLCFFRESEAFARSSSDHAASGQSEDHANGVTLWRCDEKDPKSHALLSEPLNQHQAYPLLVTYDESAKRWLPAAPGSPQASCRWILTDAEGKIDRPMKRASYLTGEVLGIPNNKTIHFYIPPSKKYPHFLSGWFPLCPEMRVRDQSVTFDWPPGEKFKQSRDVLSLKSLLRERRGDTVLADAEAAAESEEEAIQRDGDRLPRSKCTSDGGKGPYRYCAFSDAQLKECRSCSKEKFLKQFADVAEKL